MALKEPGGPLELVELPIPQPCDKEVLLKVSVCGVCRIDLHIVDGELKEPKFTPGTGPSDCRDGGREGKKRHTI